LTEATSTGGSIRDRVLVALADPDVAGRAGHSVAALVAFHEPMAVLEWIGTGKGLVLLDHAGIPAGDLAVQLDHVLAAHEKGLLFVAVAGGGPEVVEVLRDADARAHNRDQIGLYHIDPEGIVRRAAGRRLADLEKLRGGLPECAPLRPEAVAAIGERGRQERLEAVEFVRGTAHRFPHATMALIAICVLLFVMTAGNDARAQRLFDLLCNDPEGLARGEIWRLLTYAFLHQRGTFVHILVNMFSLYSIGAFLEPVLGRRRLVVLFLVSALAGGVASALLTRTVSIGASGAVWGMLGATFALLNPRLRIFPALISRNLRHRLVFLLVVNIALSFFPYIDRYCHFGGGVSGYLLARHFARRLARER
jgi:membrane associated rhomboid family serine protease